MENLWSHCTPEAAVDPRSLSQQPVNVRELSTSNPDTIISVLRRTYYASIVGALKGKQNTAMNIAIRLGGRTGEQPLAVITKAIVDDIINWATQDRNCDRVRRTLLEASSCLMSTYAKIAEPLCVPEDMLSKFTEEEGRRIHMLAADEFWQILFPKVIDSAKNESLTDKLTDDFFDQFLQMWNLQMLSADVVDNSVNEMMDVRNTMKTMVYNMSMIANAVETVLGVKTNDCGSFSANEAGFVNYLLDNYRTHCDKVLTDGAIKIAAGCFVSEHTLLSLPEQVIVDIVHHLNVKVRSASKTDAVECLWKRLVTESKHKYKNLMYPDLQNACQKTTYKNNERSVINLSHSTKFQKSGGALNELGGLFTSNLGQPKYEVYRKKMHALLVYFGPPPDIMRQVIEAIWMRFCDSPLQHTHLCNLDKMYEFLEEEGEGYNDTPSHWETHDYALKFLHMSSPSEERVTACARSGRVIVSDGSDITTTLGLDEAIAQLKCHCYEEKREKKN